MRKKIPDRWIDFNGCVTTALIKNGDKPHGEGLICRDLIKLLSTGDKDLCIPVVVQEYNETHHAESGIYPIEPGLQITYSKYKDDPLLEEMGIHNYLYQLPLWYIIYCYLRTFENGISDNPELSLDDAKQKNSS